MKTLSSCQRVLGVGIAAAILAACGGSQSTAPQLPATPSQAAGAKNSGAVPVLGHTRPLRYTITDIGTLGGVFAVAVGVNNRGDASGFSLLYGNTVTHAFDWHDGALTDLGTLGGPNSYAPEAAPPNERGEVAGLSDTSTLDPYSDNFCGAFDNQQTSPYICNAFVWRAGSMTALPTLGGPNAEAVQINNRGASTGAAETVKDPNCSPYFPLVFDFEGVIWGPKTGEIRKLRPLGSDNISASAAINDKDEAVGFSGSCALALPIEAVLWRNGTPINLGTLGGAVFNIAFALNNNSEVVGESDLKGDTTHHAFLWRKGKMMDLGSILGLPFSLATDINNKTQVVGFSQGYSSYNTTAWIWQNGTMTDLNTLIPPSSPWFFIEAEGINDRGQIAGVAYNSDTGQYDAVLATPCNKSSCNDVLTSKSRMVALPRSAQDAFKRLHRFNRFAGWPAR